MSKEQLGIKNKELGIVSNKNMGFEVFFKKKRI